MPTQTDLILCDQKGTEMSLYYDTADDPSISGGSSCTSPVWVFNKAVTGDMNIGETEDEEEQSSRDPAQLYKQYGESKPDLEVTGELLVDPGYDGYRYMNAMRAGSYGRNCLVLTSYISNVGAVGFKGKFRNFDRSISGPASGQSRQQFKLKPASCVKAGCVITPVNVAVADAVASYSPGTFSLLSMEDMAAEILAHPVYQAVNKMADSDVEVYTDISPLLKFLGEESVDNLLTSLVETSIPQPEVAPRSGRRIKPNPKGVGGFIASALAEALNNIVKNTTVGKE